MRRALMILCAAVILTGCSPLCVSANAEGLCPQTVASLTPYLGDPRQTRSGQRVEVRQCQLNSDIGAMQIVAWAAGAPAPALVIDTELRGLKQLVMISGAYAFEIVSASASEVVGIVFDKGRPRQEIRDSTKGTTIITSTQDSITIEMNDGSGRKRTHVLPGSLSRH